MTKSELAACIALRNPELTKKAAEELVNAIFDHMKQSLARGERIEIRGFGSFQVKERGPRAGRNPKTGVTVSVDNKRIPCFKVGKELRERVNHRRAAA